MGFLDKIKGFFEGEKEEIAERIEISDIDNWLSRKEEELDGMLIEKRESLYLELDGILEKLEGDLKVLKEVEVNSFKVEDRLKEFTETGRDEYVGEVRNLIGIMKNKAEYEAGFISKEIKNFAIRTSGSYNKVTLLIGKEVGKIRESISRIKRLESDFLNGNKNLIDKKNKIKNLLEKNKGKKNIERKINEIKREINSTKKKIDEYNEEIADIEIKVKSVIESEDYKISDRMKKEKMEKGNFLEDLKKEVNGLLDKKVLEKIAHEENVGSRKVVESFLMDPVGVIMKGDYKILEFVEKARGKIKDNLIKVKYKDKALKNLEVSREDFESYNQRLKKIIGELKELDSKISEIKVDVDDEKKEKIVIENSITSEKKRLRILDKKKGKLGDVLEGLNGELLRGFG